jgi:hypothetical protein
MKKCISLFIAALLLNASNVRAQKVSTNVGYGAAAAQSEQKATTAQSSAGSSQKLVGSRTHVSISEAIAESKANPSTDLALNPGNVQTDNSIVSGHFEADNNVRSKGGQNVTEHVNVNYSISPAPFSNELNLVLNTADPVKFSAEIVTGNRKVAQWAATERSHLHNAKMDISKLNSGNYKVNVYWEKSNTLLYSIPFKKENSSK